jgi:hypothetical protein
MDATEAETDRPSNSRTGPPADAAGADEGAVAGNKARYVLVTQCFQNDLFANGGCRLALPGFVVRMMLLGKERQFDFEQGDKGRRRLPPEVLAEGPLGKLLEATIGRRRGGKDGAGTLHMINIRDWHRPGPSYDTERRAYGPHCEAGTWGADYLDGLEGYLDPYRAPPEEEARYFEEGSVRIYHVHSDSLFDFKPRSDLIEAKRGKFHAAALEDLLDVIVQGDDDDLNCLRKVMREGPDSTKLHDLAQRAVGRDGSPPPTYLAVIGVYTDLKVKTLLTGIRTRYNLENLAVSDTFTASYTLERHLAGLDFAKKVLGVEVVHGINDLVRFLGGSTELDDEAALISSEAYSRYQSFFQDQQNVLAYQSQRLQEYLLLTERRAIRVYDTVRWSNIFLIVWGSAFLVATLVLTILAAVSKHVRWELPAVTGGISLAQFAGAFVVDPAKDLQKNLTNLATFKMILESHSLKTALTRFHLTTPRTLREFRDAKEATLAAQQVEVLRQELNVIASADRLDYSRLEALGIKLPDVAAEPAPEALQVTGGDGKPPSE